MQTDYKDIDTLLRETAKNDNATLPFDAWKQELLARTAHMEQGSTTDAQPPAPIDMREAKRKAKLRPMIISVASVAAALLVLLAVRPLLGNYYNQSAAPEALPELMEAEPFAMPEAPMRAANDEDIAVQDMAPDMVPTGDAAIPPLAASLAAPDPQLLLQEQQAIEAVQAVRYRGADDQTEDIPKADPIESEPPLDAGTAPQSHFISGEGAQDNDASPEAAFTAPYASLVFDCTFTVQPLEGDPFTATYPSVFTVNLNEPDSMETYLVLPDDFTVIGTVVEE